jgi:hypothetical protein
MLAFLGKVLPRGVVPGEYVNAEYEERTGIVLGFHDMEERLNGLRTPELVHLRPTVNP